MTTKRTPAQVWKAIEEAALDDAVEEILAMSDAEVDARLVAAGADPATLHAEGEAFAKELLARRDRLAWQEDMEAKLGEVRAAATAARLAPRPKLPRAELVARIAEARNDPRFAGPVAALFRSKTPEASTDEELETLLLQIELLAKLESD